MVVILHGAIKIFRTAINILVYLFRKNSIHTFFSHVRLLDKFI